MSNTDDTGVSLGDGTAIGDVDDSAVSLGDGDAGNVSDNTIDDSQVAGVGDNEVDIHAELQVDTTIDTDVDIDAPAAAVPAPHAEEPQLLDG